LTRGEPLAPLSGRADDFTWPRASIAPAGANVPASVSAPAGVQPSAPVAAKDPTAPGEEPKAPGEQSKAQARVTPRAADLPNVDPAAPPAPPPPRPHRSASPRCGAAAPNADQTLRLRCLALDFVRRGGVRARSRGQRRTPHAARSVGGASRPR